MTVNDAAFTGTSASVTGSGSAIGHAAAVFFARAGDLDTAVPWLRADGLAVRSEPGGGIVAREHVGMRRVEMSLNRRVSHQHEEQLGHSAPAVGAVAAPVAEGTARRS